MAFVWRGENKKNRIPGVYDKKKGIEVVNISLEAAREDWKRNGGLHNASGNRWRPLLRMRFNRKIQGMRVHRRRGTKKGRTRC